MTRRAKVAVLRDRIVAAQKYWMPSTSRTLQPRMYTGICDVSIWVKKFSSERKNQTNKKQITSVDKQYVEDI